MSTQAMDGQQGGWQQGNIEIPFTACPQASGSGGARTSSSG